MAREKKSFVIPALSKSQMREDLDEGVEQTRHSSSAVMKEAQIQQLKTIVRKLEKDQVLSLDPSEIKPTRFKNRNEIFLQTESFHDLKQQIIADGQIIPICVRPSEDQNYKYDLIYGRRRLEACRQLGIEVKAIKSDSSDKELLINQWLENQRADLNYIEEMSNLVLMKEEGIFDSDKEIAEALGMSKSKVSQLLSLQAIPEWLFDEYLTEIIHSDNSEFITVDIAPFSAVRSKFNKLFANKTHEQIRQFRELLSQNKKEYFSLSGKTKWALRINFITQLFENGSVTSKTTQRTPKEIDNTLKFDGKNFGRITGSREQGLNIKISRSWYSQEVAKEIEDAVFKILKKHNSQ